MNDLRKAAQRALKAMEDGEDRADMIEFSDALVALRQALAEPEQEPVAWMDREGDVYKELPSPHWCPPHTPLYAHPRTSRKPLSEAMKEQCPYSEANPTLRGAFFDGWMRAEAAHGITGEQK